MTATPRFAAIAAVLALACGDDAGGDGAPEFEELPALFAARVCPEIESCFDTRTRESLFGADGCAGRLTAQLEDGDFAHVQDAIDDERVSYDDSQVEACISAVEGLGCEFGSSRVFESAACERVFEGSAELGDDCAVDAECLGAAFCQMDAGCPGTCTALLAAGDPCDEDDDCEDGLACPDELGTCTALAEAGDTCGADVGGTCRAGLLCTGEDTDTGSAGTCRSYDDVFAAELGDACDFDSGQLCEPDLSCIVTAITGNVPELECAARVESGATCNFGVPSQCPNDEYCDADITAGEFEGSCQALPGAGEVCGEVAGSPACAPGLHCDVDNRCHDLNRLGQPCASDDGCASGECMAGSCERPETCAP